MVVDNRLRNSVWEFEETMRTNICSDLTVADSLVDTHKV